jgi:hypothetical protein
MNKEEEALRFYTDCTRNLQLTFFTFDFSFVL